MTVSYGFYNSLAGDRVYDATELSSIFDGIVADGVFQNYGSALAVTAGGGMNLNVASGRAWFKHTWTLNSATLVLTVDTADPTLPRIDLVILEVNSNSAVRANSIKILKGTPASSPVAPTLSSSGNIYQYALCQVAVGAGVTTITAGNLTNKVGTAGTPFVTGILETIDVDWLFANWDFQFQEWFSNLVDQLTGTQVTNLQNQIDALVKFSEYGARIVWDSATGYHVEPGRRVINGSMLTWSSNVVRSSLSLSASTLYYVYVYNNSGSAALEENTTTPTWNTTHRYWQKSADASRRLVGTLRTDSSNNIYRFVTTLTHNDLEYYYYSGVGSSAPFVIISATASESSWSTIALTTLVPANAAVTWYCAPKVVLPTDGDDGILAISSVNLGASATGGGGPFTIRGSAGRVNTKLFTGRSWIPIEVSQTSYYRTQAIAGTITADIECHGYRMSI